MGFHGWDEIVPPRSVYLVSIFYFLLLLFFSPRLFPLTQFFFLGIISFIIFFGPTFNPKFFFGEVPTYPKPPIALLCTNPPTSLILLTLSPPTSFYTHIHQQSFQPGKSLKNSNFRECEIHKSFKALWSVKSASTRRPSRWWQQEHKSKRSFKVVVEVGA